MICVLLLHSSGSDWLHLFNFRSLWSTSLPRTVRKPCKPSPAASLPIEWWSPNTTIQTCIIDTSFKAQMSLTGAPSSLFQFVSLGSVSFFSPLKVVNVSLESSPGKDILYLLLNKLNCSVCFFRTEYLTPSFSLHPYSELISFWYCETAVVYITFAVH